MSKFYTEGVVKEITVKEGELVAFLLEPVSPYTFEHKKDDGRVEKYLLFVEDIINPGKSHIVIPTQEFIAAKPYDLNTFLIAKANRMRVQIGVEFDEKGIKEGTTVQVKFN